MDEDMDNLLLIGNYTDLDYWDNPMKEENPYTNSTNNDTFSSSASASLNSIAGENIADFTTEINNLSDTSWVSKVGHIDSGLDYDVNFTVAENYSLFTYNDSLFNSDQLAFCHGGAIEQPNLIEFVTNGILICVIGAMGILGNTISILILSRPEMKSSINCCLLGLSCMDLILLITSFLMFALPVISRYSGIMTLYFYYIYPRITPFIYTLGMMCQTGSVYMTMAVTIERYIAVCHPLKSRIWCTYGRARGYILAVVAIAIIYNLPRFYEATFVDCESETGQVFSLAIPTELRMNPHYIKWYITSSYFLVMYFIPFLVLAIFNILIYMQVQKANQERQQLSKIQRKEMSLAMMLICVVIVFFLCNILAFSVNILELSGYVTFTHFDNLVKFSNLLVTVNSSANFIIYCIFGQKFKNIFLRQFCCQNKFDMKYSFYDDFQTHSLRAEHGRMIHLNGLTNDVFKIDGRNLNSTCTTQLVRNYSRSNCLRQNSFYS